jgi:lipocalin-like protein
MANANCVAQQSQAPLAHNQTSRLTADRFECPDDVSRRFLGTWRLVGFSQNAQPHPVYGRAPSGTIRYESDGTMAVQIMPDPAIATLWPESAPVVPGYIAYFGSYRIDPQARTVAHERGGNVSQGEPRAVVRHYEFLPGGRLALTLDEDPTAQVLWQRVQ